MEGLSPIRSILVRRSTNKEVPRVWNATASARDQRQMGRSETDGTDDVWSCVAPPPPSTRGRITDLRMVCDAIPSLLATGCPWRATPLCCPPWTTIQNSFDAWRDTGVIARMRDALRAGARAPAGRVASPTAAGIDSPSMTTTKMAGSSGRHPGSGRRAGRQSREAGGGTGYPDTVGRQRHRGRRTKRAEMGVPDVLEIVDKPKGIQAFTILSRRGVVERTCAWMSRCRQRSKDFERSLESALTGAQRAACRFLIRQRARNAST